MLIEYLILSSVVIACGVTSYYIGWKEGVKYGSQVLLDHMLDAGSYDAEKKQTTIIIEDTPDEQQA